ncbi:MAG TPA: pyridoxal-phosphate dependent enzyme [Thermoanaerobaculia bacterium]|nr:pyridoxal-phosphate dependent enzyme [Thermoanaerobaculia bacterium]
MRPTAAGILAAARLIAPHSAAAPLVRSPLLSDEYQCEMFVKNETASPIASFKWRGALTAVLRETRASRGVVTASTGNHGQGVAWAAGVAGVTAHVFLPRQANPAKRRKIELLGATIHDRDGDLDAVKEVALAFARERGLLFVDDGESRDVIEGAGTVGLEIAAGMEEPPDLVFVPMGSGSLAAGVAIAVKQKHAARVVAVQSSGAPAMAESFRAGKAVERPAETVADGLICRIPARLALDSLLQYVDECMTVSDQEILAAGRETAAMAHLLVEPAGAAALAAAAKRRHDLAGKRVVLIATGANLTGSVLRRMICDG